MFKRKRRGFAGVMAFVLILTTVCSLFSFNTEAVTVSKKDYDVYLYGTCAFLCNKENVGSEIGTEYFMTYTVKKASAVSKQQGLVGTADVSRRYPYDKGGYIRLSNYCPDRMNLFIEGATYFIKFVVAEGGFRYTLAYSKDGVTEYLVPEEYYGTGKDAMKYFGIWMDNGSTRAELTNVRCYDAKGNDLGVEITTGQGLVLEAGKVLKKDTKVDHRYDITVQNQSCIAISYVKKPTTDTVFIEYKVESAAYEFQQEGIALSDNQPVASYPHSHGSLRYDQHGDNGKGSDSIFLLEVGAEYIIYMKRTSAGFDVYAQKTKDGVVTTHLFSTFYQTYYGEELDTFSLWFGEQGRGSFVLKDFKFYDANGNDLKVQCNKSAKFVHHGAMEDYAGCEATYYCEENGNSLALFADQSLKITKDGQTVDGTYAISENIMTLTAQGEKEQYDYLYAKVTDSEGMVYRRLYSYQVAFVTGSETEIPTQELSNETGYLAMRPEAPVMEGYEFEGWCLKDGTDFDFEKIVTNSVTLYAKYKGEDGEVLIVDDEPEKTLNATWIVTGAVLVVIGVAAAILLVKKGKKHGQVNNSNS